MHVLSIPIIVPCRSYMHTTCRSKKDWMVRIAWSSFEYKDVCFVGTIEPMYYDSAWMAKYML